MLYTNNNKKVTRKAIKSGLKGIAKLSGHIHKKAQVKQKYLHMGDK